MNFLSALPRVIQGGMGVAVSNWRLARAVSRTGQLGVVSGSMLDTVFVRRLQDGDPGGHMRRAIAAFPVPEVGEEILRRYFNAAGRAPGAPYKALPMYKQVVSDARQRVTVLANFVEVWLAKEGHGNPVGLNLLTKVQMPNLASLYGAMLAGVDVVIMGAGIPREIPGALDALAEHRATQLRFEVEGLPREQSEWLTFDPASCANRTVGGTSLHRPAFVAVVSAASLATTLARKSNGRVDGFIVEGPTAGGHNAPPRGELRLNERGEPIYGERDAVDLDKMRELGLPFWLAGGFGSPEGLGQAIAAGAAGVHLRGDAMAASRVREIAPASWLIGRSVHDLEECRAVAAGGGCDFLLFGTVFPSAGKPAGHATAGVDGLARAVAGVPLPVIGIGGIDTARADAIGRTGSAGLAGVEVFWSVRDASEARARIEDLRQAFDRGSQVSLQWRPHS